jgi:hypothetical protein
MKMSTTTLDHLVTAALLCLFTSAVAHAETVNCTPVASLPATISTQGVYCLTANLATNAAAGNAITINANNVTIDLNSWKVGGQAAGTATQAVGIYSTADNVTIKNGIVRGFYIGIHLTGRGAVVEDMLVDQNTTEGVYVEGQGAIVRRNQIVDTGGSTTASDVNIFGIVSSGSGATVDDNIVSGLAATGAGDETGIDISGQYSISRHNIVTDDTKPAGGGSSYGITPDAQEISVVDNTVTNFNFGIYYNGGAGIYARNVVAGCDTPFTSGIATAGSSNNSN